VSRAARVVSRRGGQLRALMSLLLHGATFVLLLACSLHFVSCGCFVPCGVRRASRERQNSEDRHLACFAGTDAIRTG
jgi:hypothetical protein